ncbi:MAG: DUF5012 domain-containing protein [Muribaculaceae bacterium]|nr:DUF5012 domain-containing protein [Muribaculaceae bacterium]
MKKYISALTVGVTLALFASCSKDTEGLTGITYYPVLELQGPVYDTAVAGTPFQDPGCTASLNGEDYSSNIVVTTKMDLSNPKPGYYSVVYSATNSDGFSASVTRYVLVSENTDPISGYYTTNGDSFRDYNGQVFYGGYPEVVYANGDGTYHISDLLAGWYEYRAGYGSAYALGGEIKVDDDGTITLISSFLSGWGDSANGLTDGVFDAEAGTIKYVVSYTDYPFLFNVTLNKD